MILFLVRDIEFTESSPSFVWFLSEFLEKIHPFTVDSFPLVPFRDGGVDVTMSLQIYLKYIKYSFKLTECKRNLQRHNSRLK